MKTKHLIPAVLIAVISTTSVMVAQTKKRRSTRRPVANSLVLNRVTAAKILEGAIRQRHADYTETIDLEPTTITTQNLRELFPGYQMAEEHGWITLRREGNLTHITLTDSGNRLFEGPPTPGIRKAGEGVYQYLVGTPVLGRVTGIRMFNDNEARIDYTWRLRFSELLGGGLSSSETPANVRVIRYDDGWRWVNY